MSALKCPFTKRGPRPLLSYTVFYWNNRVVINSDQKSHRTGTIANSHSCHFHYSWRCLIALPSKNLAWPRVASAFHSEITDRQACETPLTPAPIPRSPLGPPSRLSRLRSYFSTSPVTGVTSCLLQHDATACPDSRCHRIILFRARLTLTINFL
jgi:hypothetical protein